MSEPHRIRKPEPERSEPIRSWSAAYGPGAARGGRPAPGADGEPAAVPPAARAVDLGYRIMDESLRQGLDAARRLGGRDADPAALAGDFQELSSRMFRYTSDLMGVWFELLGMASAGGVAPEAFEARSQQSAGTAGPGAAPPAGPPPAAPDPSIAVSVALRSSRPAEAIVDLRPRAAIQSLAVHDLRAVEPEKPRIEGVVCEVAPDEPLRIRVEIPDHQPAGTYTGVIVDDATSLPVGTLCVRISE